MLQARRSQALDFGLFVVAAQSHCRLGIRVSVKCGDFFGSEGTALKFQAQHRCFRELIQIVRIGGTEIALRRNVETHGLGDGGDEMLFQPAGAAHLMSVIDAGLSAILRQVVQ